MARPKMSPMPKTLFLYLVLLILFGAGVLLVLQYGAQLQVHSAGAAVSRPAHGGALLDNLRQPLSVLLLQVIVILGVAKTLGPLLHKIGQPTVMGEIAAGIVLGPSLLGLLFPAAQAYLFPAAGLDALKLLSQVGVILFMFGVGVELDLRHVRRKAEAAVLVSHVSIVAPFFLGAAFSLWLYPSLAPPDISFAAFALFMGIALSVTAFPVLARILAERGLSGSPLGAVTIACAAVDDATAWGLLAAVVALAQASGAANAALTLALTLLFVGVMLFLVRPWLERRLGADDDDWLRGRSFLANLLLFIFISALATEAIGIHALFGAFLAGAIMPAHAHLQQFLKQRLEAVSSILLLPLFFAFTGLRTRIDLLDDWRGWTWCLGIIAVAVAGKLGASLLAARWTGMRWREAFALGALMNTRGLIELIVLNIGYDLGILSPTVFTMMVIMALATTAMTGPLLSLAGYKPVAPAHH